MPNISANDMDESSVTDGAIAPDDRYLVIGSTGYTGVESLEWDAKDLPNIVDYDVIVVDVRALNEKMLPLVSSERFEMLRTQLTRLLHSNGRIVVVSDFLRNHKRPQRYPDHVTNYDWCPVRVQLANESGESIEIKEERFPGYIKHLLNWSYYFFLPSSCLTKELTNLYGSTHNTKYKVPLTPFVVNRYGKTIAGSFHIEVTAEQEKSSGFSTSDPDTPDSITGEVTLLPLIDKLDHKEAVRLALEDLIGISMVYVPPSWVESINVPHVPKIEEEIQEKEKEIDAISGKIGKLENRLESLNDFKKLLYSSGFELEEIVKRCFEELGAKVTPAKYGQEEYILEYEDTEYLVEVKGVSKSITLTHLRQLNDYILKYEEDTGKACKGILFGNAWRTIPLQERNTPEKPEFPSNVVTRANQWNISLISSTMFYEAFCRFLSDRSKGPQVLRDIIDASGVIEFSDPKESNSIDLKGVGVKLS